MYDIPNCFIEAESRLRQNLNIHTLLSNQYLLKTGFWHAAISNIPDDKRAAFSSQLLRVMAAKGGLIPSETLAQKRKRRQDMAIAVKKLCTKIQSDPELQSLHLTNLINLLNGDIGRETRKVFYTFQEPHPTYTPQPSGYTYTRERVRREPVGGWATVNHSLNHTPVTLSVLLSDLAKALDDFQPISETDDVTQDRYPDITPTSGIKNAQELLLERHLCRLFSEYLPTPQYRLVAEAVTAVFGVEADQDEIACRWRSFRRYNQEGRE